MGSLLSNPVAPWAELVPNAPYPMRVADLATLPDDGYTYEIVAGRLVRMPSSGIKASWVGVNLLIALGGFVKTHNLGIVTGPDGTYDLTLPGELTETVVVPDAAFVLAGRLPAMETVEAEKYGKLAPDLAIEIASPSQFHPEMSEKARLYLARGVRMVWLIWPTTQKVEIWRPGTDTPVATLGKQDILDGLDVVPGFTLPVADLFK